VVSLPSQIVRPPTFNTSIVPEITNIASWYVAMISIAFPIAFSLWLVEFFDGIGTITGLAIKANLVDDKGKPINIGKALYTDAAATVIGGLAGTSTTVVYIESASGIESGGRTGLTALVVGVLFLLFLPLAPLAVIIPGYATAPVLILVGLSFISIIKKLDLDDLTESIPAFVAIIGIPLTYSIATGIGLAFISYTAIKILSGRIKDLSIATIAITIMFLAYFASLPALH
jgi:AGZA family xanthine/uracil permease-like MFS transporter